VHGIELLDGLCEKGLQRSRVRLLQQVSDGLLQLCGIEADWRDLLHQGEVLLQDGRGLGHENGVVGHHHFVQSLDGDIVSFDELGAVCGESIGLQSLQVDHVEESLELLNDAFKLHV